MLTLQRASRGRRPRLAVPQLILSLAAATVTTALPSAVSASSQTRTREVIKAYANLPLSFEATQGQAGSRTRFLSRGVGYTLSLTPTGAVMELRKARHDAPGETAALRMRWIGADPEPRITGIEELPGKSNYLVGRDARQWRTGISHFARVRYEGVYPGIDLIFYGHQGELEYDLVIAPGADPRAIALSFEGAASPALDD